MWKWNIEIQSCGSNEPITYYIGKYISKVEPTDRSRGVAQAIQQIQRQEDDTPRKLFKICFKILQKSATRI